MKRFWQISLALVLGLGSIGSAWGQYPIGGIAPYDRLVGSGPAYFGDYYGYRNHASTLQEGILTGQGNLLRGAGEYNRNSAEAVKTVEQARALYLQNARTGLKTYFELKELNAKYRAANAPVPVSKEKLDQWNLDDQPARLTRREYNSDTGRVQWPSVLMTPAFDPSRQQLEALFGRRAASEFGVNSDFFRMVNQETDRMQDLLKFYLRSEDRFFSDQEYIAAKNFLSSLAHEARLAPDLDGLVAN